MRRILHSMFAAALGACLFSSAPAVAAEKIVIGVPQWAYAQAIAAVLKVVAEDNFGVEVGSVPGNHPSFFKAMDQGRGEVDIHPDVWLPNNQSFVDQYVIENKTVVLTKTTFEAKQGFCTTKAASDKYGLKSIYDLSKPEISQLTDTNGDGKGEIWVGAPGWTSTNVDKVRARDLGFGDLYELTTSDETLVLSQVDAAAKAGKVMIWTCYSPHHFFAIHQLVFLEEPPHDPAKWNPVHPDDDADWYAKSMVATAWPPTYSHIAYSKRLQTAAPEVAKLLDNIKFGTELIDEWAYVISVEKREPNEYAKEWVSKNKTTVDAWLGR